MYLGLDYRPSLGLNSLAFMYALLDANFTSQDTNKQADYQESKVPQKCCRQHEWLDYSSTEGGLQCATLPSDLAHIAGNSSWFRSFSTFGIVDKVFCRTSDNVETWTKSNADHFLYHQANKSVYNIANQTYYYIACSDYINLHQHYNEAINYEQAEYFTELETEIAGALICSVLKEDFRDQVRNFLSLYGMGASTCLLALTFYLYASTPQLRRKVHDKCFLCQLASFIVAFVFTIWRQQLQKQEETADLCSFVAFMNQYWLLSAFSWLTIMCIDLWRAISAQRWHLSNKWKFIIYCICAWGFPLLIFFTTFWATTLTEDVFYKVDFLQGFCWFPLNNGVTFFKQPEFIFFYSYISLSLLINVCLFILITSIIISNDYRWRKHKDSRRHEADKKRFLLYLKLFSAMGLTWLVEIISYYFDSNDNRLFLLLLDLQGNILQGILIFVVSVCNSRVKEILKNRFLSKPRESTRTLSVCPIRGL